LKKPLEKLSKKIQFKDDEGDYVTITSDLEYTEAFKAATTQGNLDLQILVEAKPETMKEIQHAANCDACNQKIKGIRYKCSNCPDFDLCEACEAVNLEKSLHDPDHIFLKIYRPIPLGIRKILPNFYDSNVEKVEENVESTEHKFKQNEHFEPRRDLETRLSKIEGDLMKIQRLMSNKDKSKKEKPVPRREKRFGVNKRKVEVQDKLGKEKEIEEVKAEVKVEVKAEVKSESQSELQSVIQLMKQSEPEIQLKQSEPEIQSRQSEPEVQSVSHPWEEQIMLLQAMGFLDHKLNLELLEHYQDINRVVEHLI